MPAAGPSACSSVAAPAPLLVLPPPTVPSAAPRFAAPPAPATASTTTASSALAHKCARVQGPERSARWPCSSTLVGERPVRRTARGDRRKADGVVASVNEAAALTVEAAGRSDGVGSNGTGSCSVGCAASGGADRQRGSGSVHHSDVALVAAAAAEPAVGVVLCCDASAARAASASSPGCSDGGELDGANVRSSCRRSCADSGSRSAAAGSTRSGSQSERLSIVSSKTRKPSNPDASSRASAALARWEGHATGDCAGNAPPLPTVVAASKEPARRRRARCGPVAERGVDAAAAATADAAAAVACPDGFCAVPTNAK